MEDRVDAAAIRAFLKNLSETIPHSVLAAVLDGSHPIKAFREHRGMTQAQLAKATGTSSAYISQIERNGRRAGRKLRVKLAKTLRVAPDLLERDEN